NPVPVGYAFRPALRGGLTLGGFTSPRKPWAFGDRASHPVYRYSFRHDHSRLVHGPSPCRFALTRDALLPLDVSRTRRFGTPLSPVHYRRRAPRPVSYYALLKWWLLLSQHPGCHGGPT